LNEKGRDFGTSSACAVEEMSLNFRQNLKRKITWSKKEYNFS
jgi:hypothetical protein